MTTNAVTATNNVDDHILVLKGASKENNADELKSILKATLELDGEKLKDISFCDETSTYRLTVDSQDTLTKAFENRGKLEHPLTLCHPGEVSDETTTVTAADGGDQGKDEKANKDDSADDKGQAKPTGKTNKQIVAEMEEHYKQEVDEMTPDFNSLQESWDGAPEFQWKSCASAEEKRRLTLECVLQKDLLNPCIYAAMQRATQVNYQMNRVSLVRYDKHPFTDRRGTLTMYYLNDNLAMKTAMAFLPFIRTPKRKIKILLPDTPTAQKFGNTLTSRLGKLLEPKPLFWRTLLLRNAGGDEITDQLILDGLNLTERAGEIKFVRRDDAAGRKCVLMIFEDPTLCAYTHANEHLVIKFDNEEEKQKQDDENKSTSKGESGAPVLTELKEDTEEHAEKKAIEAKNEDKTDLKSKITSEKKEDRKEDRKNDDKENRKRTSFKPIHMAQEISWATLMLQEEVRHFEKQDNKPTSEKKKPNTSGSGRVQQREGGGRFSSKRPNQMGNRANTGPPNKRSNMDRGMRDNRPRGGGGGMNRGPVNPWQNAPQSTYASYSGGNVSSTGWGGSQTSDIQQRLMRQEQMINQLANELDRRGSYGGQQSGYGGIPAQQSNVGVHGYSNFTMMQGYGGNQSDGWGSNTGGGSWGSRGSGQRGGRGNRGGGYRK